MLFNFYLLLFADYFTAISEHALVRLGAIY